MSEIVKTIRLSATLRNVAGAKEIHVRVAPEATVRDLLQGLVHTHAALANYVVAPDGGLNNGVLFTVGGKHIDFLQGLDTPVGSQDNLMLIPPLAGG